MKKVLFPIFTVLLFVCMCSATCSRVCTCQGYLGGFPVTDVYEEEIDMDEKCSSISNYDKEFMSGIKCR